MSHTPRLMLNPCSSQRGASLVIALFILVVLALLGGALMRIMSSANDQAAHTVLSTRAFLSAESGAQLCLGEIFGGSGGTGCASCPALVGDCSSSVTSTYGGDTSWLSCTAQATCCRIDPGDNNHHYRVSSTGTCGTAGDQTVRRIEVMAKEDSYR